MFAAWAVMASSRKHARGACTARAHLLRTYFHVEATSRHFNSRSHALIT
jgi:hypothetical protein